MSEKTQSPQEVMEEACNKIEMPPYFDQCMIISGQYSKRGDESYNLGNQKVFYDEIIDNENLDYKLTVIIDAKDRANLLNSSQQTFKVKMSCKKNPMQDGSIRFQAKVIKVLHSGEVMKCRTICTAQLEKKNKRDVGRYVHDKLLLGEKVSIGLVVSKTSQVVADINQAQKVGKEHIQIDFIRSNMMRPDQLIADLSWCNSQGYDIVGLARGGGSGLKALDNPSLVECLLNMSAITVDATGHAEDRRRTSKAVDKAFATPTDLGSYFSNVASHAIQARTKSEGRPRQTGKRTMYQDKKGELFKYLYIILMLAVAAVYVPFQFN